MTPFLVIGFILILLISLYAQWRVKSAFHEFSAVPVGSGMTGADTAQRILDAAGIPDVRIEETQSFLGDHYNPATKTLCLSSDVYHTPSVAAVGIAAHECGHAIQHKVGYAPLKARAAVVPLAMVAGNVLPFVMLFGGFLFGGFGPRGHGMFLVHVGFWCYLVLTVFQLITLPVEFDASRRAKLILGEMGIVRRGPEAAGVNKVLDTAALTYVAAFVATAFHLVRFWLILQSGRSRD
jgi:Zn-dependent membrane protease YugP